MGDKILVDKKLFQKMVAQIEKSSKLLEKYASAQQTSYEAIQQLCDIMEKQGYLKTKEEKVKVLNEMKNNPTKIAQYVANYLEKNEERPSLGQPSDFYSTSTADPIYKFCFNSDL